MRRALVTGSAGFVGSHLASALAREGWYVTGIDRVLPHPHVPDVPPLWLRGGTDAYALFTGPTFGSDPPYDLVVHAAATVGGRRTIEGNPLATAANLALDAALFRYAARVHIPRVVYFSSSAVYPVELQRTPGHRLRETDVDLADIRTPDAMYGWAKLTGELLARHARERGVRVHVLRPFSGYGPGQSYDYPFPMFAARARARLDPFDIWGSGEQARDWVHIEDVVATVLAAIAADDQGPINIGWGEPVTFRELARRVCAVAGYHPRIEPHPDEPSGVPWRVADPTRLHGLRAPQVGLDEGIEQALSLAVSVP